MDRYLTVSLSAMRQLFRASMKKLNAERTREPEGEANGKRYTHETKIK